MIKDADNQLKETNQQQNNFNESISKGQKELKKIGINVNIKKTSIERQVTGSFDMKTGKAYINKKEVSLDEYSKFANMSQKEKIQNYGQTQKFDTSVNKNNIISKPLISKDLTSSITPSSTNKEIVIDNIIPSQNQTIGQGGGETDIIVVESSLNSNVKESLLLDAAYT